MNENTKIKEESSLDQEETETEQSEVKPEQTKGETKKKLKSFLKDFLESLATAIIIVIILFNFVLYSVEVSGTSMYPTLVPGQRGVSFIITKAFNINRFDIAVIDSDKTRNEDDEDKLLVKRIIGLPNETIAYVDNKLYVNGVYVEEPFLNDVKTNDFEVTLGEDEYYCLGDNREHSTDSRVYGSFLKSEIRSTKLFIFYPFKDAGMKY